jgi:phosphohistidine swiveling domain-containing protein
MQGWISGEEIVVDAGDRAAPDAPTILPAARAADLARLARRVREILGDDLIEWGWGSREGLLLLQSRDTRSERSAAEIVVLPPANAAESIAAIRVARIVRRFFGPFVDETVLPWALLADRVPALESVAESSRDPADALVEARAIARRLAADAWNLPEDAAIAAASRAIDALRSGVPDCALAARLQVSVSLDPSLVRHLIGLLRRLERTLDRTRAPQRDRWEPFLYATVSAYGERVAASAAVAGIAAGRARYVDVPSAAPPEFDRKILIVPRPLPAFAPLLWNAAGLVSIGGGAGAHLIEIARSLGVPSVLRCRLDRVIAEGAESYLLAVDGDEGFVSVLSAPL